MSTRIGITSKSQAGVVLLEILAAILIFSIGILAVIGLQASAVSSVADAKYRVDAAALADQTIGRMWADQANIGTYAGTTPLTALPDGSMTVATAAIAGGGNSITVTITWQPPGGSTHTFSTVARIYPS